MMPSTVKRLWIKPQNCRWLRQPNGKTDDEAMSTKQRREGILEVVVGSPSQDERDQTDPTALTDVNACKANELSSLTHCLKCPWVREKK